MPTITPILKVKISTVRSQVESMSHSDVTHLQSPTNVPIKHQLPISYTFQYIAWTIGQGQYGKIKGQIKVTP